MSENVQRVKQLNPEYEYKLYDDLDCRKFLLDNFGVNYANAFDSLIPGAFKCDFWRYAVLYVNGGVYLDMDIKPLYGFRDILLDTDEFLSVADQKNGIDRITGIYQAFIACRPKHPILLYSLNLTFANIVTRRLSVNTLDISGPTVMGNAFNLYFNKADTYSEINSGKYGQSIRLFRMTPKHTIDLDDRVIFDNKYDGYSRGSTNYATSLNFYRTNPWKRSSIIQTVIFRFGNILLAIFLIIIVLLIWMYVNHKRKCNLLK
jgi:hypothetical protein